MALFKKGRRSKYRPEFSGKLLSLITRTQRPFSRFMSEGGKITPARISKLSLNQQKKLAKAIKKSRNLGMLPLGSQAYDNHSHPEAISAVPFSMD